MRKRGVGLAALVFGMAAAACSADGKGEVNEDFSDLDTLDSKSDAFSYRMKLLGALESGDVRGFSYVNSPRFWAYEFSGQIGDLVDVWVTSESGDPVTWILNGSFAVVAQNDDADDGSTLDSHVTVELPYSKNGRYYVVMRDYDLARHPFTVDFWQLTAE